MNGARVEDRIDPDVVEEQPISTNPLEGEEGPSTWQGGAQEGGFGPPVNRARQAYAARAVKRKDHVYAGLFAIFLGLFGIHKFYLGYNNAAFIMLSVSIIGSIVSLGIAAAVVWVIAIIEGITYLTKTQAEFDRIYVNNTREWF